MNKKFNLKHIVTMALCCMLPILIVSLLPVIQLVLPGAAPILAFLSPFICPIMMVSMMFFMGKGDKKHECCDQKKEEKIEL